LFVIRDRNYSVMEGIHSYRPRVQMEKTITMKQKTYGVMKVPRDWVAFMDTFIKVESAKQPNSMFQSFIPEQHMYIGWIPYDQSGKETFPEKSVNGSGYPIEDVVIDHVMILNEIDLK
jgi:hypothetical protein